MKLEFDEQIAKSDTDLTNHLKKRTDNLYHNSFFIYAYPYLKEHNITENPY